MYTSLVLKKLLPRTLKHAICRFSSTSKGKKFVLGCGSNVVDQIYKVQAVPKVGEKGFFQSPTKLLEKSVVGGVTMNHLSWASLLGVPTGLLALQGNDLCGELIRKTMQEMKINQNFLRIQNDYTTAESFVFVQQDGERSIVMASGATSLISEDKVTNYFKEAILNKASMLTTEISQVPLSGVIQLLTLAKEAGIITVLDFDVSPMVAFNEANLGNLDQVKRILQLVDVLKPAKHAALEVVKLMRSDIKDSLQPCDIAKYLQDISSANLVAMTNGRKSTFLSTPEHLVEVPTNKLENVVDSTGAGDAFLGGIIAGIHFNGLPEAEDQIRKLGEIANKTGAANCQVLGGLPDESSKLYLTEELKYFNVTTESRSKETDSNSLDGFKNSLRRDIDATEHIFQCLDDDDLSKVLDLIFTCKGNVLTSGIGKSGIVANRFASSLSSIGTASHFVHASEWSHGDLGKIHKNDIIIFISHSGNTEEIVEAAHLIKRKNVPIIALLGYQGSLLGDMSDGKICYGSKNIIEPLGGIPTTSIILQDAIINGIMCELIQRKKLTRSDFVFNHPGGSLGRKFLKRIKH